MIKIEDCNQNDWNKFAIHADRSNFLNSWQWGEVHNTIGEKVYRLAISKDNKLSGLLLAIVKNARRGRYLEVPGGPLIDWSDKSVVKEVVSYLKTLARENNCIFVRVRPQLKDSEDSRSLLTGMGFRRALMHLNAEHTNILDITISEEDILKNMRQQTRYEIKRSIKEGIVVSWSSSKEDLELFQEVQSDTAKRQGFITSSSKFLNAQLADFGDHFRIYKTEKDGNLLSMAIIIFFGNEADYYEGASTLASRKLPGAYALQWQAIRDAKAAGITRYNFWGISGSNNSKHRYAGVTTFKRGFGGEDFTFVPAHDLVIQNIKYIKNWSIELVRKKMRNL